MVLKSVLRVTGSPLSLRLLAPLSLANGVAVSTLYVNQGLLSRVGEDFGVSAQSLPLPAATLLGYALGVAGLAAFARDLADQRVLAAHHIGLVAALCMAAAAFSPAMLVAACFLVGVGCALTQRLLCCATQAASSRHRARNIGVVVAAGLCGIILARACGPELAAVLGWRGVFWANAVLAALAGLGSWAALARSRLPLLDESPVPVPTVAALWKEYAMLRSSAVQHAAMFAAFNMAWVAFPLTVSGIGGRPAALIAVVALLGAGAAFMSGRCCGKFGPARVASVGIAAIAFSGAAWALGEQTSISCYVWMALIDGGTQVALVANQTRVQSLVSTAPARGRLAAILTTVGFAGGAVGSAIGQLLAHQGHVSAVWGIVGLLGAFGMVVGRASSGAVRRAMPHSATA